MPFDNEPLGGGNGCRLSATIIRKHQRLASCRGGFANPPSSELPPIGGMMNEIQLPLNYQVFLSLLNRRQVEYLLVGGFAVRYYGYLRDTQDLDVWTRPRSDNAEKLIDVCQSLGLEAEGLIFEAFTYERRMYRIDFPPV